MGTTQPPAPFTLWVKGTTTRIPPRPAKPVPACTGEGAGGRHRAAVAGAVEGEQGAERVTTADGGQRHRLLSPLRYTPEWTDTRFLLSHVWPVAPDPGVTSPP